MSETISIAYLNETSPAIVTFRVFVSVIDSMTVIIVRECKNNKKIALYQVFYSLDRLKVVPLAYLLDI